VRTANQPESTGFESWRDLKRRNDTGSSRIPSPLAHHARPVRQYRTDATLSRLLSPSPPIHGSGCLQLHPAATTARRWTVSHLHMDISASWRTETGRRRGPRAPVSAARRMTRVRRPAGMAGRPDRVGWVVQWQAMSRRCQRRMVAGVTSNPRRRRLGSTRVRVAMRARSAQFTRGRGLPRWSTASWWRKTRISISFAR
jgi:hypothetical protein